MPHVTASIQSDACVGDNGLRLSSASLDAEADADSKTDAADAATSFRKLKAQPEGC